MSGAFAQRRTARAGGRRLHPWPVRAVHWTNAVAMLVMITSGWGIYDDDVIIRGLHFSKNMRLGDWAAWSLNWHFAGMWLLAINGLCYPAYGVLTGRLRERLLPIRLHDVIRTVLDTRERDGIRFECPRRVSSSRLKSAQPHPNQSAPENVGCGLPEPILAALG